MSTSEGHAPTAGTAMEALASLMAHLRSPQGCAWDRAQTTCSLIPYTIEEVYEVVEAVETGNLENLREELGDLLFHVVFYSQIADEEGHFTLAEVIQRVVDKMRGRHPHVFGTLQAATPAEVVAQWEGIKQREKAGHGETGNRSVFEGVSSKLPALLWAIKIQQKMAKVGFDWEDVTGVVNQVRLEQEEFLEAWRDQDQDALEAELGDLLFSIANMARRLHINPEAALRRATRKCQNRFRHMEETLWSSGRQPGQTPVEELETLWQASKRHYP